MDHEVGGEEIGPIATSAIALSGAREFKFRGLQKITLDLEAGIKGVLCVFRGERPEEVRSHAGVKILADLETIRLERDGNWEDPVYKRFVDGSKAAIRLLKESTQL